MANARSGEFTLTRTRSGEAEAREALGGILPAEAAALLDRSMLLLSQLFVYERMVRNLDLPEIAVRVGAADGTVRIEVRDGGSGSVLDALRQPSTTGRAGWSPHVLGRVADRWGLVSAEGGAWVWFELDYREHGTP